MKAVTVIMAQGAVLHGPVLLGLSPDQAAPRAHVLSDWDEEGVYLLDGGRETAFKAGETFLIDQPERLSPLLFAWEEDLADPADDGGDEAAAGDGAEGGDDAAAAPAKRGRRS